MLGEISCALFAVDAFSSIALVLAFLLLAIVFVSRVFRWRLIGKYLLISIVPFSAIDLSKHVCILGCSGSGKSNTARLLALRLSQKYPVLILDWHGEHAGLRGFKVLIPGVNFFINPVKITGKNPIEEINMIIDIIGEVFSLTDPQRYILYEALKNIIKNNLDQNLSSLIKVVENLTVKSFRENEIKLAIIRRLKPISEGRIGKLLSRDMDIDKIMKGNYIIDLSVFNSIYLRKLASLIILKNIYNYSIRRHVGSKLRHITIIEEATNIIPPRRAEDPPSIGERMYLELRKYGEVLVSIAQSPELIASSVLENTHTFIIHRLPFFTKNNFSSLELDKLRTFEAYIVSGGKVAKVKFPLIKTNNILAFISKKLLDDSLSIKTHVSPAKEPRLRGIPLDSRIKSESRNDVLLKANRIDSRIGISQASDTVLKEQLRVIADRIDKLERRVAANCNSIERLFDFIESYEAKFKDFDRRFSSLERTVRRIAEFLEYREQLRSMRGEEV
ncbi:MAG: hypothetical protein DRJ63_04105 [Thermoprotei archaeon]|nr:MAG: hypothetical protein DRJ63_04105 [Thermoprotei archaeon]